MSDDGDTKLPELLESAPTEVLQAILAERSGGDIRIAASSQFSGPLPPPDHMKQYEQVHQGFAERIITMAEKEQSHRHNVEEGALNGSIAAEKRGQHFAFLVCSAVIVGSIYLIATGHDVSGTILAGSTLVGLAAVFITGRKSEGVDQNDA